MLEDDPIFNAGKESVLNDRGGVEMDAAIMDGKELSAGAVAAISNIKNPISLAREVMMKSEHVLLIGKGAMEFADIHNAIKESDSYFVTDARLEQWKSACKGGEILLDHSDASKEKKLGTVGAVAFDVDGNLAAATSTGGLVNKKFGRVGDTPIVGAGVFADNETCAVSCTGIGEDLLRVNPAKMVSDYMLIGKCSLRDAAHKAIMYFKQRINGDGGFIAIDSTGEIAFEYTTPQMIFGYVDNAGEIVVFDKL